MRQNFLGKYAEQIIINYCENKGYNIVEKRFKRAGGEIDLIIKNDDQIIFIEVKYRKVFDDFEGIVDDKKINRIRKTIDKFLEEHPDLNKLQHTIDIIFIDKNYNITHIKNI